MGTGDEPAQGILVQNTWHFQHLPPTRPRLGHPGVRRRGERRGPAPPPAAAPSAIERAMDRYAVLVFRDQPLSEGEQVAFSRSFPVR